MGVFAAEDAVEPLPLVGAVLAHVAEQLAIAALDSRVLFCVIARHFCL